MVFSACGIKYMSSACSPHYTFSPQWPHSRGDMMRMTLWQSNCWLHVSRGRTEGHKKIYTLQQRDAVKTENLFLSYHWCIFCLIAMVYDLSLVLTVTMEADLNIVMSMLWNFECSVIEFMSIYKRILTWFFGSGTMVFFDLNTTVHEMVVFQYHTTHKSTM